MDLRAPPVRGFPLAGWLAAPVRDITGAMVGQRQYTVTATRAGAHVGSLMVLAENEDAAIAQALWQLAEAHCLNVHDLQVRFTAIAEELGEGSQGG